MAAWSFFRFNPVYIPVLETQNSINWLLAGSVPFVSYDILLARSIVNNWKLFDTALTLPSFRKKRYRRESFRIWSWNTAFVITGILALQTSENDWSKKEKNQFLLSSPTTSFVSKKTRNPCSPRGINSYISLFSAASNSSLTTPVWLLPDRDINRSNMQQKCFIRQ